MGVVGAEGEDGTRRFKPDKGFAGVDYGAAAQAGADGQPVQFERDAAEEDPFGLNSFISDVCTSSCSLVPFTSLLNSKGVPQRRTHFGLNSVISDVCTSICSFVPFTSLCGQDRHYHLCLPLDCCGHSVSLFQGPLQVLPRDCLGLLCIPFVTDT